MLQQRRTIARDLTVLVCGVLFLAAGSTGFAQSPGTAKSDGSAQLKSSMMKGMKEMDSMSMMGDVDRDFAMMMKMHHEQALDMAKIEIDHGKSAEMKAMAKKIMEAQKKEIAQFDKWLQKK